MTPAKIQLADFVGQHGAYQLFLTIFLFFRYVLLGLMANSGPLMTPDVAFYCELPAAELAALLPNISALNSSERELETRDQMRRICQLDLHLYLGANGTNSIANSGSHITNSSTASRLGSQANSRMAPARSARPASASEPSPPPVAPVASTLPVRECTEFTYDSAPDQGRTMTGEFDLVCDRDWLRSFFQSMLSAAVVVAHVFWGTFSDKYGRFKAEKLCSVVSLLAGLLSVFAVDFWTFALARSLCSFGDLGLVVSLTTTLVELVGNQYRGLSVALVNFGYALGVALLPYIVAYFEDFRSVVAFTVLAHLFTMPLVFSTDESIRWLLSNGQHKRAKRELRRIARWNRNCLRLGACCLAVAPKYPLKAPGKREPPSATAGATSLATGGGVVITLEVEAADAGQHGCKADRRAFERKFAAFVRQLEAESHEAMLEEYKSQQELAAKKQLKALESRALRRCASFNAADLLDRPQADKHQVVAPTGLAQLGSAHAALNPNLLQVRPALRQVGSCGQIASSNPEDVASLALPAYKTTSAHTSASFAGSDYEEDDRESPEGNRMARTQTDQQGADQDQREEDYRRRQQPDCINLFASQLSFIGRVNRLFRDKQLMVAVFTIVWTTFNSELQYTSFIIINLEVGEDVYLNYVLGGCMELLAAVTASLLLSYAPRRHSLITFWLLISLSCMGLSWAHIDSTWAVWLLALAKFCQSSLSSIASVAAYESFPTCLRQSGSGLVFTLGMMGSVFAPLIFAEFDDHHGMDLVLMTFSLSSMTAATLIYLFLKETRNCELQ